MKIRADFVTNSSSVSYIVTMHKETAEKFKKMFCDYSKETQQSRIYNMLTDNLLKTGETVIKPFGTIYYKLFSFSKNKDMKLFCQNPAEYNFERMSNEELLKYIFGEYFFHKKLDTIEGFGVVELPVKIQKSIDIA